MMHSRSSAWHVSLATYFGGSAFLHLLWENLQAPFYEGFESFSQHFWICFKAVWGDLLFMIMIYMTLAVVHRNPFWIADRSAYGHSATWFVTLFVGVLLAVSFELWAVHVDHRWQYAVSMPTIPVVNIGLTPILQMTFVPFLTLLLTFRYSQRL